MRLIIPLSEVSLVLFLPSVVHTDLHPCSRFLVCAHWLWHICGRPSLRYRIMTCSFRGGDICIWPSTSHFVLWGVLSSFLLWSGKTCFFPLFEICLHCFSFPLLSALSLLFVLVSVYLFLTLRKIHSLCPRREFRVLVSEVHNTKIFIICRSYHGLLHSLWGEFWCTNFHVFSAPFRPLRFSMNT